jgi:transposase InsO family protein
VNAFRFIEAEKAEQGNVAAACRLLEVSRTAFYEHAKHTPSAHELEDRALAKRITAVHADSRGTYGWPRVHQALRRDGIRCSGKRVARLMRTAGLVGRCRRRWTKTTIPDPEANAVDLVKRVFGPGMVELDRIWVGDITYIRTWEGWLYLAVVIDLASRRVVGWSMADHMRAELVTDALTMALEARRPGPGLVFHSDRGTQYTSADFRTLLAANGIVQSLSRPGQCWDNAVAESWFSTLKTEWIEREALPTRRHARRRIFDFIERFFNRRRLHSSLGYRTPAEYESMLRQKKAEGEAA